jgi:hypothetical protein
MIIIDAEPRSCKKCGNPFTPRSGSGGSVQRFCCADCRLSFHKERLRLRRMRLYAGQLREPATQEPATLLEQAEALIASLPLDQRRRLIERLLANMPPDKSETEPALPLGLTAAASKNEADGFVEFYRIFPRHIARGAAERAYRRIIKNGEATEAELLAGAMRYAAAQDGKDATYIKHPATWLNGKCWLDEPAPAAARPRSYLDSIRAGLAVHADDEGA